MSFSNLFMTEEVRREPSYLRYPEFPNHTNWLGNSGYIQPNFQNVSSGISIQYPRLPRYEGSWLEVLERNWGSDLEPSSALIGNQLNMSEWQPEERNKWEEVKESFQPIINGIGKVIGFIKTVFKFVANVACIISVTKHMFA